MQPRTVQPRTVQPRTVQPRTVQAQPRTVQPRTMQPRTMQPRTVQVQPKIKIQVAQLGSGPVPMPKKSSDKSRTPASHTVVTSKGIILPKTTPQERRKELERMEILRKQRANQKVQNECSMYINESKNVSQKCYNAMWELNCRTTPPEFKDWHRKQTYQALKEDVNLWSNLDSKHHRETCYGKYTDLSGTWTMQGNVFTIGPRTNNTSYTDLTGVQEIVYTRDLFQNNPVIQIGDNYGIVRNNTIEVAQKSEDSYMLTGEKATKMA